MPGLYQWLPALVHRPAWLDVNSFKVLKLFTAKPFQGHALCFNWLRSKAFAEQRKILIVVIIKFQQNSVILIRHLLTRKIYF